MGRPLMMASAPPSFSLQARQGIRQSLASTTTSLGPFDDVDQRSVEIEEKAHWRRRRGNLSKPSVIAGGNVCSATTARRFMRRLRFGSDFAPCGLASGRLVYGRNAKAPKVADARSHFAT